MRLLLDRHIFLSAVAGSRSLKPAVRQVIESADQVYVSAASIWEVAIKASLGRIDADANELANVIAPTGFVELPVTAAHAAGIAALMPHHGDPFDQHLVAQAIAEPLGLLTAEVVLAKYSDLVIVA